MKRALKSEQPVFNAFHQKFGSLADRTSVTQQTRVPWQWAVKQKVQAKHMQTSTINIGSLNVNNINGTVLIINELKTGTVIANTGTIGTLHNTTFVSGVITGGTVDSTVGTINTLVNGTLAGNVGTFNTLNLGTINSGSVIFGVPSYIQLQGTITNPGSPPLNAGRLYIGTVTAGTALLIQWPSGSIGTIMTAT